MCAVPKLGVPSWGILLMKDHNAKPYKEGPPSYKLGYKLG